MAFAREMSSVESEVNRSLLGPVNQRLVGGEVHGADVSRAQVRPRMKSACHTCFPRFIMGITCIIPAKW